MELHRDHGEGISKGYPEHPNRANFIVDESGDESALGVSSA
jgi:hypothetical protein